MHQAPRYDPLEKSDFFADQRASRPLVEHTVARGFLRDDTVFYTGTVSYTHLTLPTNREV